MDSKIDADQQKELARNREIDEAQQNDIDNLKEHAMDNKTTDTMQWLAIAAAVIGLLLYMNFSLIGIMRSQADTIRYFQGEVNDEVKEEVKK